MPRKKQRAHVRPVLTIEEQMERGRADYGAYVVYGYRCEKDDCEFTWQARYDASILPPPRTGAAEDMRVLTCPMCADLTACVRTIQGPIDMEEDVRRILAGGPGAPLVSLDPMGQVIEPQGPR